MNRSRRIMIFSVVLVLLSLGGILTLARLTRQQETEPDLFSATALPAENWRLTQTAHKTGVPTPTTFPPPSTTAGSLVACGWQWATQINEALSEEIRDPLIERLPENYAIEVRAESFGENCLNSDGSVRYFAAMQTDFRVIVWMSHLPVEDNIPAQHRFSPLVADILSVLVDYPPDQTPGPQPGMIGIEFRLLAIHRKTTWWVWANYENAINALNHNLTGSALFDALGGLHEQFEIMPT